MISVDGLYVHLLANDTDLISSGIEYKITLNQFVGNKLPTVAIEFQAPVKVLATILNENTKYTLTVGRGIDDKNNLHEITFYPVGWTTQGISVTLYGTVAPAYTLDRSVSVVNDTAVNALKKVIAPYFKWDSKSVSNSNDSMKWIRYNLNASEFVDEIWTHAWISEKSCLVPAVTIDGRFKFVDILATPKLYSLSTDPGADFRILDVGLMSSQSGQYNRTIGNTRGTEWQVSTGDSFAFDPKITPVYGKTFNQYAINNNFDKLFLDLGNTHENYMQAATMHGTLLNNFACNTLLVQVLDLGSLDVLDQVEVSINNDPAQGEHNQLWSGRYVVSQLTTTIVNNKYATWATLATDSQSIQ